MPRELRLADIRALTRSEIGLHPFSFSGKIEGKWQGRQDSNPRPMVLETTTLPAELHPCEKLMIPQEQSASAMVPILCRR